MSLNQTPPRGKRRGAILFEMALACGLLVLIIAAITHTSILFLTHQRRASLHEYAAREAANLLDAAAGLPFDQLTVENLQRTAPMSASAQRDLDAQVEWRVQEVKAAEGELPGRSVQVVLHWRSGDIARSTTLTAWRFLIPSAKKEAPSS